MHGTDGSHGTDAAAERKRSPTDTRRVVVALTVGVTALSFAAPFFRRASPTHPLAASAIRLAVAAVLLAPFVVRAAQRGRLSRRVLVHAILAGLAYAVHFGAWVTSLGLTTVAASVTIVTATPLLLGVVALLTGRDRPDRRHWLAIGLALAGLSIIGGHDGAFGSAALLGDGLAGLGAAAMACYLLVGRRLGDTMDVWAYSGIATAVGSAALFGFGALRGVPLGPASNEALLYLVLAALVPQLVGHGLLTWSLRHARPTVVGIATVGEPVGATFLTWAWLGERVPAVVAVGCATVLVAVIAAVREPGRPKRHWAGGG